MTVQATSFKETALQKMSNDGHKTSSNDYYRSLDRALATRYMQHVLTQRRRAAAVQRGLASPEPLRPR